MAIGWATVGILWGKPVFVALVRPSRYTYQFIEDIGTFTINVPGPAQRRWVGICGGRSGRDVDKFALLNLAVTPGQHVNSITLDACPMVYECKVVHHNDVIPANLDGQIDAESYGGRDYHRLYYGEILGTYASEEY